MRFIKDVVDGLVAAAENAEEQLGIFCLSCYAVAGVLVIVAVVLS